MAEESYSKKQKALLIAYNKGYRIIDNVVYNSKMVEVKPMLRNGYNNFCVRTNKGNDPRATNMVPFHRLVAFQKYGIEMFNHEVVRHLDGNPLNNLEDNIAVGSHSENMMDKHPHVRLQMALTATSKIRKFDPDTTEKIITDRKAGMGYNILIKKYGGSKSLYSFMFNESFRCKDDPEIQAIQNREKPMSKANKHIKLVVDNGLKYMSGKLILDQKEYIIFNSKDYPTLQFKHVPLLVHRIIAYLKYGDAMFAPKIVVRHLDGNKLNYSWDNIAIGTAQDNALDKPIEVRRNSAKTANAQMLTTLDERMANNKAYEDRNNS